jgi:competence protein ComEA
MGDAGSGRSVMAAMVTVAAWAGLGMGTPVVAAGKDLTGVVNLNTAEPRLLELLPGVGGAKAAQIVAYRARHPFRTVDELVRIKGIGRRMVRALRPHLAVAGPSTANPTARSGGSRSPIAGGANPSSGQRSGAAPKAMTMTTPRGPRPVSPSSTLHPGSSRLPLRVIGAPPTSRPNRSRANLCAPNP